MQEFKDLIEEFQNHSSTQESKQKILLKAINQNVHFYNMIRNHEDRINHLCQSFKLHKYKRGDLIYRNNQNVKEVHWILEGQMSCWDKKTEQDINTEMKLNGVVQQFITNNDMNMLTKDQADRFQNIQIRLNFLRDLELDAMIREIDTKNQYFLLDNICSLKRVRFLEAGEIAGENCAISGQKYDGLCVVSSQECQVLSLSTDNYNHIFNMNKENFYFIKETLQQVFGFANQKLITRLAYQFEVLNYQYNQVIYSEGDIADCVYIIKSGEVEIVKSLNMNQYQSLQNLGNTNQKDLSGKQNQNQLDRNVEISSPTQLSGSTNEALTKLGLVCEFSKYKRKIKPKVTETQIVLRNCGILGLEDYEVEVTQVQPEKDIEDTNITKKKKGEKSNQDNIKKQKLRYVKAISKSNDTVLLRIRDKYIDTLLREQGINRSKISEKLKMQKQQYHSERLQKLHQYVRQNTLHNVTGQGAISQSAITPNNPNNNTLNNIPPTTFSSNSAINFNIVKDSDDIQKNLSITRKLDQSSLPHLVQKSQVHFGVIPDRKDSESSSSNPSLKNIPYEYDETLQTTNENTQSTPLVKPLSISRSGMKHLSQIDLRGNSSRKFNDECNSAEPTPTVYSRNNNKRFTDYSATSTATTASLNSMQKLSPTLSIPINPYTNYQQTQQKPNNSGSNSAMNSPLVPTQEQQRMKLERYRPVKTMTEIHHYNHQSNRDDTSPMPYLHPIVAAEKSINQIQSKQQKITSSDYIQDTNIFYNSNTQHKNRNTQSLQSLSTLNKTHHSGTNMTATPQKVQLDLLFLLPEKTKMLNQKRLMRQESMVHQKSATPKVEECCKKMVNFKNSGSSSCKIGCSLGQKSDIIPLAEIDNQQQQLSIQEYLPEKIQNNPNQVDKKIFINRLKGIHPILKKCKTLAFTDSDSPEADESSNEQLPQKNQQQQDSINQDSSFTQCLSQRECQNKALLQTQSKIQIKQFNQNNNINTSSSCKNEIKNSNSLTCTPILKPIQQQKHNTPPKNCFNLNSPHVQHNNISESQPNLNQMSNSNKKDNQAPISIISYSKQNEVQVDSGFCQNKQKSIFLQPRSKNIAELLRRNNYRATKNQLLIQQNEIASKTQQIKHESQYHHHHHLISDSHPLITNINKSNISNTHLKSIQIQ